MTQQQPNALSALRAREASLYNFRRASIVQRDRHQQQTDMYQRQIDNYNAELASIDAALELLEAATNYTKEGQTSEEDLDQH